MVMLGITKVFGIHPLSTMNGGPKFHGSPDDTCQRMLLKTKSVILPMPLDKRSEDHSSQLDSSSGEFRFISVCGSLNQRGGRLTERLCLS